MTISFFELFKTDPINLDDPTFYPSVFTFISQQRKITQVLDADNLRRVSAEEYDHLSKRIDATNIQESCNVRNVLRTRRLANLLIDDQGLLHIELISKAILYMESNLYSLGPDRQHDTKRNEQILNVLKWIQENKSSHLLFKQISKPHAHPLADNIIRETLSLSPSINITDAHAKRAALSALMCTLRQNVGSCFATAPAILIHDEQYERFLLDIQEILNTGRLTRTFEGIEYTAPICDSWGAGDLRRFLHLNYESFNPLAAIWYAPGLIDALEKTSILDPDLSLEEKASLLKKLILKVFPRWNEKNPTLHTSAEEILSRILMKEFHITKEDLQAYEMRPKEIIYSNLLIQQHSLSSSKAHNKKESCANYLSALETAKNSFKALADNALLKTWEFTLASFSETKTDFTRWNLYASLGLEPQEPDGIGQAIFKILNEKIEDYNHRHQELQFEYEHLYAQLKQQEVRMQNPGSESEAQWIRASYQAKMVEFQHLEERRNTFHAKAQLLANLYDPLMQNFDRLFPQYFQEVYDPDLHEVAVGPYDDSPAGFRLLFKHGRANTSQWTKVKNSQEFIDSLAKFFTAIELDLENIEHFKEIKEEIAEIISAIVLQVRSDEFIESAFHRMAVAHHVQPISKPLDNLDKIPAKPWAYISGGTMNTLLSCYYLRNQKPTEVARWVESPIELLVFFADTLKQIPPKLMEEYNLYKDKSMLMHSPTHAFSLKPGFTPFKEAWVNELFTYTFVRDILIKPMKNFVENLVLDQETQYYILNYLRNLLPLHCRHLFTKSCSPLPGLITPYDLREHVLDVIDQTNGLYLDGVPVLSQDEVDSALYKILPVFPKEELKLRLGKLWLNLSGINKETLDNLSVSLENFLQEGRFESRVIGAHTLQELATAFLLMELKVTSTPIDYLKEISKAAQLLGYAIPHPIIVADTNWTKDYFAFVFNPGSGVLDFWRVDALGKIGSPISAWKPYYNGTQKNKLWGIYSKPYEYTS